MSPNRKATIAQLTEDALCDPIGTEVAEELFGVNHGLTAQQIERLGRYICRERVRKYREGMNDCRDTLVAKTYLSRCRDSLFLAGWRLNVFGRTLMRFVAKANPLQPTVQRRE